MRRVTLSSLAGLGALVGCLGLAACSGTPAAPPPGFDTARSAATPSPSTSAAAATSSCPPTPSPLGCLRYVSTGGSDTDGAVGWLAAQHLGFQVRSGGGRTVLEVDTPCNALHVEVRVSETAIVPDPATLGGTTMGCLGAAGTREDWAREFVSAPLAITEHSGTLTLTGSGRTVALEPALGWTLSR